MAELATMVAASGDVEHCHEIGRLSGAGEHGGGAALKRADLGGDGVAGGICQTGVEIALGFQIKELSHISECRTWMWYSGRWDLAGLAVFGRITGLNAVFRGAAWNMRNHLIM